MHARRTLLAATVLALPLLSAGAQGRRRPTPAPGGAPPISATELLDARRELDLSPRQVARLDSIERSQVAQRRTLMQQMQKQRDSVCANRNPCRLSAEERESFRGRLGTESFRRSDSLGRSLAFSVLDSTQRGRVQGWRQGQRRAMMARGQMGRDIGPRGMGRGFRDQGARRPRGPQFQGMGPRGTRREMDRDFGPRFRRPRMAPDDMGPGFRGRGMRQDDQGPNGRPEAQPDSTR